MNIKESIKNFLHKIPAFLSGFMLGVILTGAFFLFKINDYIIQLKQSLYPKITVIENKDGHSTNDKKTKTYNKPKKQNNNVPNEDTTILNNDDSSTNETAQIIEEKILSEKNIQIIHLNENSKDTLLSQLAEAPEYIKNNNIKIVFKKTPFNNKGYYFEDNHLVLYGLEDIPYINVYEYKNDLYIKYDKLIFQLPYTNRFQPLIKVQNEHLLAKMTE
ncbi:MAG: hypothetical protein AB1304_11540 [Bacteroidota bacterium]